jgi:hypothetical protein
MSSQTNNGGKREGFRLSLDGWAVLVALVLAAAVRLHFLKSIPW